MVALQEVRDATGGARETEDRCNAGAGKGAVHHDMEDTNPSMQDPYEGARQVCHSMFVAGSMGAVE